MDEMKWGRALSGELKKRWPKDGQGKFIEPVFLCRKKCVDMDDTLTVNMLEAFGIPCLRIYPGDGSFGHVVLGMSGSGADIYVPGTMHEDALKLIEEETADYENL